MSALDITVGIFAGLGAGLALGLFSASAVNIIAPLVILAAGTPAYKAIGISLSADTAASIAAAIVYGQYNNIKLKPAMMLLVFGIGAAAAGSTLSHYMAGDKLSGAIGLGILITGIIFFRRSMAESSTDVMRWLPQRLRVSKTFHRVMPSLLGFIIGFLAGLFGAGGGLLILLVLTFVPPL